MLSSLALSQLSMQFSDDERQIDRDLDAVFGERQRCDFWGLTEASPHNRVRERVRLAVKRHGLHLAQAGPGDTLIVSPHEPYANGAHFVHPGRPGPASQGGHGPRYIDWAAARIHGERVYFHEAHWLAHLATSEARRLDHTRMTRAMIRHVADKAVGRRLSFFAGDINVDEATDTGRNHALPDWLFHQGGLETVWDELKRTPATHGRRTIDVIGSYTLDRRVSARRVEVLPLLNSDHHQVIAHYSIED